MLNESIFTAENLEEIPEEVSKELKDEKNYKEIFKEMFLIKKELSLNELILGTYKGYKKQITRKTATTTCYYLTSRGILSRSKENPRIFLLNESPIKKPKKEKKINKEVENIKEVEDIKENEIN